MGDRFRADRLARPRGTGEVERQRQSGRVALTKAPPIEDEVMPRHVHQRLIQRLPGGFGQDHVGERALGLDGLDDAAVAGDAAEDAEERISHRFSVTDAPRGRALSWTGARPLPRGNPKRKPIAEIAERRRAAEGRLRAAPPSSLHSHCRTQLSGKPFTIRLMPAFIVSAPKFSSNPTGYLPSRRYV